MCHAIPAPVLEFVDLPRGRASVAATVVTPEAADAR